jgi:lipopolysaccharide transport system permease protein
MVKEIWTRRALINSLVRRTFVLRYRQSFGGVLWAIVPSLGILIAGSIVFDNGAAADGGPHPYILLTMAALVPWSLFASSITFGVPSIVQAQPMVTRLPFPKATLPIAAIGTSMIDLAISGVLFVVLSYVIGDGLPLTALWFPVLIAVEMLMIAGILLLGSAMNVFAWDIKMIVPMATQFWLLITPVMYSLESVRDMRSLYLANPMTGIVESSRRVLVYGQPPAFDLLMPTIIGASVLLLIGMWYFSSVENRFADVI